MIYIKTKSLTYAVLTGKSEFTIDFKCRDRHPYKADYRFRQIASCIFGIAI